MDACHEFIYFSSVLSDDYLFCKRNQVQLYTSCTNYVNSAKELECEFTIVSPDNIPFHIVKGHENEILGKNIFIDINWNMHKNSIIARNMHKRKKNIRIGAGTHIARIEFVQQPIFGTYIILIFVTETSFF